MRSQGLVKPCIMIFEVTREPCVEPLAEFAAANRFIVFEVVHDVTNLIKQPLVIALVLRELIVTVFTPP